jgi:predicted RNase H-like nuclease (RuvC/YqgF family)
MFDIKKPEEEQNNVEQEATEPFKTSEETYTDEKQGEVIIVQESFESTQAEVLSTLESLGGEEQILIAEKLQLQNMEETLKQEIITEIEVKRHRIENLKYEISELKQRCEALAKALDIPVQK